MEDDIRRMLDDVRGHNEALPTGHVRITTSVELEKPRPNLGTTPAVIEHPQIFTVGTLNSFSRDVVLETLLDAADYVFVSKDFAKYHGYGSKTEAVEGFSKRIRSGQDPAKFYCVGAGGGGGGGEGRGSIRGRKDVEVAATRGVRGHPPEILLIQML